MCMCVCESQPEPPPKPPVLMLATPKELKAVMQCGVAMVMNQKEEDVLVRSLSLPHDWVPLEAESNLLARGVEESIERRTKGDHPLFVLHLVTAWVPLPCI
jgi:hypothetical protein